MFLKKCDFVIALTHMTWPNDIELAEKVPEIDLFLGGNLSIFQIFWTLKWIDFIFNKDMITTMWFNR